MSTFYHDFTLSMFVATAVLLPVDVGAQGICVPPAVPAAVHEAAGMSVRDFATSLSHVGISGGFIVAKSDHDQAPSRHWQALVRSDDRDPVPIGRILERFGRASEGYAVDVRRGQILVSRRNETLPYPLRLSVEKFVVNDVPITEAWTAVRRLVDPSVPPDRGYAFSILGRADGPLPSLPRVSLDLERVTVLDILAELVCQAPGTVWSLVVHDDEDTPVYQFAIIWPIGGGSISEKFR